MSTRTRLSDRTSPFGTFPITERSVASRTSYCSAVYFHYDKQNFGIPTNTKTDNEILEIESNPTSATRGVIEEEIVSMNISKSIDQASGSFNLTLLPTRNWKRELSAGDWILIYMNDRYGNEDRYEGGGARDTKNLLLIGNIDRVSRNLQKNEDDDKTELRYVVSGKNFGKVFEKTDIWFDPYANQIETLNQIALVNAGFELQGSPAEMCNALVDTFLGGGHVFRGTTGRTPDFGNWQLPPELVQIFITPARTAGAGGPVLTGGPTVDNRFIDILSVEINENLPGFKVRQMLSLESNGSLHDLIKRCSNTLTNEHFYEEVRDSQGNVRPTLIVDSKPINTPFFESHFGQNFPGDRVAALQELNGTVRTLQELGTTNFLEISPEEIKFEDLGKDDHSKINMVWLKTTLEYEHVVNSLANVNKEIGIANPTFLRPSVQRDGLRRLDQTLEFCYVRGTNNATINNASRNVNLFKAFLAQLYDMHFANHLYDAGTIECTGVKEAELGKALVVLPIPTQRNALRKVYYIEGYEHEWSFPNQWSTTFTVTHGQFLISNPEPITAGPGGPTLTNNIDGDVVQSFAERSRIFIDEAADDFGQDDELINNSYLGKTITEKS